MAKASNELSMESSFIQKSFFGLKKAITSPRSTVSWVFRGHLARDQVYVSQTYWFTGNLPRVPLNEICPGLRDAQVTLPRAFDRKTGKTASITVEEACHLGALAGSKRGGKALEIGTSDGNTALLLAANLGRDGRVVTVDLPPDFQLRQQESLAFADGEFNLTPRDQLGRQYQGHPLEPQIRQIYGDSGKLDWKEFGGPFDLVFIDGSHTEAYVRSDSANAMRVLAPGGIVAWHDYGMIPAVSTVVDQLAADAGGMKIYAIEGTRLAVGLP